MKNDAAFTGLEAAIVLIAFVVVAAVFSYVMLGAGFFTSQKSKEVVHTGVDQATSSIELAGDIIGNGNSGATSTTLASIDIPLSLTAGNNPVDLTKLVVSYNSPSVYVANVWGDGVTANYAEAAVYGTYATPATDYYYYWIQDDINNVMLEQFEKVMLHIALTNAANPSSTLTADITPAVNTELTLEIKPSTGATLTIPLKTPPKFKAVQVLL
jgi:archaeal flagellin FlaB